MRDALNLIIAKSQQAAEEALKCLAAVRAKSPMVAQRYERVLALALSDPGAKWTEEERALLASYLSSGEDSRTVTLSPVRVTVAERDEIKARAEAAELSVSEYLRRAALGLL